MKKMNYILAFLLVIATVAIVILKPPVNKMVKIEQVNLSVDEKNLDTNTTESKIEWNNWHSNLTNKLLTQLKAPQEEPVNTVNLIEFNVDNRGNISNIKITAQPDKYSKAARDAFFPCVNNLNGDSVLKFPENSNRKVILVRLPITIINGKTSYVTPKDFSDYEEVRK